MDPNSRNQQWSQWVFAVDLLRRSFFEVSFATVKANVARFMRKGFGSAARCRIEQKITPAGSTRYVVTVQAEGANANDPEKRAYMETCVRRFMENGLGRVRVSMEVSLLAGSPEDGRPADQWLIMPPLRMEA